MESRTININDYTKFIVTGRFYQGKRFKAMHYDATYGGAMTALSINLWRGSVWGVRKDTGKRERLKWVTN